MTNQPTKCFSPIPKGSGRTNPQAFDETNQRQRQPLQRSSSSTEQADRRLGTPQRERVCQAVSTSLRIDGNRTDSGPVQSGAQLGVSAVSERQTEVDDAKERREQDETIPDY